MSMKTMTIRQLHKHIVEAINKVSASPEYMKKEMIRSKLQQLIVEAVASGEIVDQHGIDQFHKDVDMALSALRMVPFDVWSKVANGNAPKRTKKGK